MNNSGSLYNGWVFKLIIVNVLIYAVQIFVQQYQIIYSIQGFNGTASAINFYLGLIPAVVIEKGYIWQIFSYMFLHSTSGFFHLFFNMYALLIFGVPIENEWGSKKFLIYYFICGAGAGVSIFLLNLATMNMGFYIPTIGASGAVFGMLLAFGILFPDAELLLFFVLPIKAKYLVILYGGVELYLEMFGGTSSISHIGHLGGLLTGIIFFIIMRKRNITFKTKIIKANFNKKLTKRSLPDDESPERMDPGNRETKLEILKKIREKGYTSLSDDEIQYIKYLDIMTDDHGNNELCSENDLDITDDYCSKCENFDICFLREVKKTN